MSADQTAKLNNLKAQIEKGKMETAKASANLETYTKQREEIVKGLAELGVAPEELDTVIAGLDTEIAENLARAEELLKGGQ